MAKRMRAQSANGDNDFSYRIFPGGHFYLRDYEDEVISEVIRRLPGIKDGD